MKTDGKTFICPCLLTHRSSNTLEENSCRRNHFIDGKQRMEKILKTQIWIDIFQAEKTVHAQ